MNKKWYEYIDDVLFIGVQVASVGFLVYAAVFGW